MYIHTISFTRPGSAHMKIRASNFVTVSLDFHLKLKFSLVQNFTAIFVHSSDTNFHDFTKYSILCYILRECFFFFFFWTFVFHFRFVAAAIISENCYCKRTIKRHQVNPSHQRNDEITYLVLENSIRLNELYQFFSESKLNEIDVNSEHTSLKRNRAFNVSINFGFISSQWNE